MKILNHCFLALCGFAIIGSDGPFTTTLKSGIRVIQTLAKIVKHRAKFEHDVALGSAEMPA